MTLFTANPHKVTQAYFDQLKARVPHIDLEPGAMTHDEIMYAAGMHKVLDWVRASIDHTPSATINREVKTT